MKYLFIQDLQHLEMKDIWYKVEVANISWRSSVDCLVNDCQQRSSFDLLNRSVDIGRQRQSTSVDHLTLVGKCWSPTYVVYVSWWQLMAVGQSSSVGRLTSEAVDMVLSISSSAQQNSTEFTLACKLQTGIYRELEFIERNICISGTVSLDISFYKH